MELGEAIQKKKDMEYAILCAVNAIVDDFFKQTGLKPSKIDLITVDSTSFGDRRRDTIITGVEATVEV